MVVHLLIRILDIYRVRWGCTFPCLWVPLGCQLCLYHLISQRVGLMGYVLYMFWKWYFSWILQLVHHPHHHLPYLVPRLGGLMHPRYVLLLICRIYGTGCIMVPSWRWMHCHLVLVVQSWWTHVYPPSMRGLYYLLLLIIFCAGYSGIDPSVVDWVVFI